MHQKPLEGVVSVVPVPFHEDESIDEKSLAQVTEWLAEIGVGGICLPAYGSEFYKLAESEREQVVRVAMNTNAGRVPLIAQANHGSARIAADTAAQYEQLGADVIAFAIPRQFASGRDDLLRYCATICQAVSVPVLVQDFNPGRATIDVDFIETLHERCSNFRYVKLEEPMIVDKFKRIQDRLGDRVSVLEGWGGYYMLESVPVGCRGIMPGAPLADLLDVVFKATVAGEHERAYDLFGSLLPFINFTLQDFELFLQVEKRLLVRRGLFEHHRCRSITLTPSADVLRHVDYLIDQICRVLDREGLAVAHCV